jgi:uncharacterized protein YegP (UPF0339 family)
MSITTIDNDYLPCEIYMQKMDSASEIFPGFISFQHTDGNYYFAWIHDSKIILRSEAYPSQDKMERGMKAVIKNREIADRYTLESDDNNRYLVLSGGSKNTAHTGNFQEHNEIGRSCPHKSLSALSTLLAGALGARFAAAVVPLQTNAGASSVETTAKILEEETFTKNVGVASASKKYTAPTAEGRSFLYKALPLLILIPVGISYIKLKSCNGVDQQASNQLTSTRIQERNATTKITGVEPS